ncbi:MAG: 8-amino-7-oxononanoate synthase [Pseudomonadota bacterium]
MVSDKYLADELQRRRAHHLYRTRRVLHSPQGAEVIVDGQRLLCFCSNDYLGLANHPAVIEALQQGATSFGVGSGAAHLICGHHAAHQALEEELAAFTGRSRALLFSTGYMANLGVVSALAHAGQVVHEDRLNHASLIDAALLSTARLQRYPHRDVASLQKHLEYKARNGHEALLVSDGVFSMDGDLAPIPQLADLARRYNARLVIDDAHGLGVLGKNGGGALEHFGMRGEDDVHVLVGTLGKAFGTFGAFVAGSENLIETLIQESRCYIYTTAVPPALAHATRVGLRLVRSEAWRREHLHNLIARFRAGAAQLNLPVMPSDTPIQPLRVGDGEKALALSEALRARGLLISAIRPPSVPRGSARLRITLSAAHSEAHIDRLLETLADVIRHHFTQ